MTESALPLIQSIDEWYTWECAFAVGMALGRLSEITGRQFNTRVRYRHPGGVIQFIDSGVVIGEVPMAAGFAEVQRELERIVWKNCEGDWND